VYEDIVMPKNTGAAVIIAGFVFLLGFGIVWHMWWLALIGLIGATVGILIRVFTEETEYIIPAEEVARTEKALRARYSAV
jgi:cytochrome o ubiquinol oxidase subunit 1